MSLQITILEVFIEIFNGDLGVLWLHSSRTNKMRYSTKKNFKSKSYPFKLFCKINR